MGFEDCLKQVKSNYPALDLVKVSMDAPLPTTPAGDAVLEETNDSTESDQDTQDDDVILPQPTLNPPVILTSSANPPTVDDPLARDAPNLPLQGDEGPTRPPCFMNLAFFFPFYCNCSLISRHCPFLFFLGLCL